MNFNDAVGQPLETGDKVAQLTWHGSRNSFAIRTITELGTQFSYGKEDYLPFARLDGGRRKFAPRNLVKLYGISPEQMDRIRHERDHHE